MPDANAFRLLRVQVSGICAHPCQTGILAGRRTRLSAGKKKAQTVASRGPSYKPATAGFHPHIARALANAAWDQSAAACSLASGMVVWVWAVLFRAAVRKLADREKSPEAAEL